MGKWKIGVTRAIVLRKNTTNLSGNISDEYLTRFLFLLNHLSPNFLGSASSNPFFSFSFLSLEYCVLSNKSNKAQYNDFSAHLFSAHCLRWMFATCKTLVREVPSSWWCQRQNLHFLKNLMQDGTPCCLTQVLIWEDCKHSVVITDRSMWSLWPQWDEEMHVLEVKKRVPGGVQG